MDRYLDTAVCVYIYIFILEPARGLPQDDNGSWSWSENSLLTSNPDCHGACVQDPIFNINPYSHIVFTPTLLY